MLLAARRHLDAITDSLLAIIQTLVATVPEPGTQCGAADGGYAKSATPFGRLTSLSVIPDISERHSSKTFHVQSDCEQYFAHNGSKAQSELWCGKICHQPQEI